MIDIKWHKYENFKNEIEANTRFIAESAHYSFYVVTKYTSC